MEQHVGALESEQDTLESQLDAAENTLTQLNRQIGTQSGILDQHRAEITALTERKLSLESTNVDLANLTDIERELKAELSSLQAEVAQFGTTRETERAQVDTLKKEVSTLEKSITSLRRQRRREQTDLAAIEKKIASLEQSSTLPADAPAQPEITPIESETHVKGRLLIASKDYEGAKDLLQPLASQCDTEAQMLLAQAFAESAEPFKAYLWYRTAAVIASMDVSTEIESAAKSLLPAETEQADRVAKNIAGKCPA